MKAILVTVCLFLISTTVAGTDVKMPEKLDATGFRSVLADAGKAFISGQPTRKGLQRLASEGITTVINFRTAKEMADRVDFDEAAAAKELGLTYINIPLGGENHPYSPEALTAFADAMKASKGKVLVHCASAYRASHMWAAYLARYEGLSLEDAMKHGRAANMGTTPFETLVGGVNYSLKEPN